MLVVCKVLTTAQQYYLNNFILPQMHITFTKLINFYYQFTLIFFCAMCRFQNLGIIHIAKREVKEIIKQRKKTALIDHARLRRPDCSIEEIRQSITPTDMKKV